MNKEINASHAIPFICMYPYKNVEMPGRGFELTIIIADAASESVRKRLRNQCQKLKEIKVFSIVIFVASQNDWNPNFAIKSGADAWFVAASYDEANEIADGFQNVVGIPGQINLDPNDVKTILYGTSGKQSYYATGEDLTGNIGQAIKNAVKYANDRGLDIKDYKKILFSITYNTALSREQMEPLNDFINKLSDLHPDSFEFKWGVAISHDMPEGAVRITLIA